MPWLNQRWRCTLGHICVTGLQHVSVLQNLTNTNCFIYSGIYLIKFWLKAWQLCCCCAENIQSVGQLTSHEILLVFIYSEIQWFKFRLEPGGDGVVYILMCRKYTIQWSTGTNATVKQKGARFHFNKYFRRMCSVATFNLQLWIMEVVVQTVWISPVGHH